MSESTRMESHHTETGYLEITDKVALVDCVVTLIDAFTQAEIDGTPIPLDELEQAHGLALMAVGRGIDETEEIRRENMQTGKWLVDRVTEFLEQGDPSPVSFALLAEDCTARMNGE